MRHGCKTFEQMRVQDENKTLVQDMGMNVVI